MLVRVPEAYLLIAQIECTRPGLLVLDPRGHRVSAMALTGSPDAEKVAAWLRKPVAPARDRVRLRVETESGENLDALVVALRELPGVRSVSAKGGDVTLVLSAAQFRPDTILAVAAKMKVKAQIVQPVKVSLDRVDPSAPDPTAALLAAPGVWAAGGGEQPYAYVLPCLLDPDFLARAAPGHRVDAKRRRYRFDDLPKGGGGAAVAMAPLRVPGVLSVVPEVFEDVVTVVARAGVDDAAIRSAFSAAGSTPLAEPNPPK